MANWVNGRIVPKGTKEQIEQFTNFINSNEEWKYVVNRECPSEMEENEIHIYDNNAAHAVEIAETMEETFRDIDFHFFVCDELNGVGWSIDYENGIEKCKFWEQKDFNSEYLEVTQEFENEVTDKYIEERKLEHKKEEEKDFLPY